MSQLTASPRRGLVFLKGESSARYEADVIEHDTRINLFRVIHRPGDPGPVSDRTIPMDVVREIRYVPRERAAA
jgi:hypothetical protein